MIRFRADTLQLIDTCNEIVSDYQAQDLKLTLRQPMIWPRDISASLAKALLTKTKEPPASMMNAARLSPSRSSSARSFQSSFTSARDMR